MYKLMTFVRRKRGTTKEQFKAYQENVHVDLAYKYVRPYATKYLRRYIAPIRNLVVSDQPPHPDFDCVVEEWFESEAAYKDYEQATSDPQIAGEIAQDATAYLDPNNLFTFLVDEHLGWGPPEPAPQTMYKLMYFGRRKPGTTREQFRRHYENVHSMFGERLLPPHCKKYVRRYIEPVRNVLNPSQASHPDFDCVAESWFDSEADCREFECSVSNDPELLKAAVADEEKFVDRANNFCWLVEDHLSWGPSEPGKVLVPRPWKSARSPV